MNFLNGSIHHHDPQRKDENTLGVQASVGCEQNGETIPCRSVKLIGSGLTEADYAALESRWIDRSLAARAQLRRADSLTGAEVIGRKGGDYAGLLIPYFHPVSNQLREYRLRRDHPDLEYDFAGNLKVRQKYLSAPGRSNMLYLPPGASQLLLRDSALPIGATPTRILLSTPAIQRLVMFASDVELKSPTVMIDQPENVWFLLCTLSVTLAAQEPALIFQPRENGRYQEGVRTAPSNAPRLDLISATAGFTDTYSVLPKTFQAAFYIPASQQAYLDVRELEPLYNYWLSIETSKGHPGRFQDFAWATDTVIRKLTWHKELKLAQLGAVARLEQKSPDSDEEVVSPVSLFWNAIPNSPPAYVFAFYPNQRMRLEFQLFEDGKKSPLEPARKFPSVAARKSHIETYSPVGWPEGWYRIVVAGYSIDDNTAVNLTVRFYHSHRQQN